MADEKLIQIILKLFGLYQSDHKIHIVTSENALPHNIVTIFEHNSVRYGLLYDDTADDDESFVLNQINMVDVREYELLETPVTQPDGARYAFGVDNREYYLARSVYGQPRN